MLLRRRQAAKHIFAVTGQPFDRSSDFFERHIRNPEYDCIVALALEALDYEDIVLINAPFTREIRNMEYILNLKDKLSEKNANLVVVWVETSPEVVHERMILRNSERDTWKLAHWDEYLAECNFDIPSNLDDPKIKDDLLIIKNDNQYELEASMKEVLDILEDNV